MILERRDYEVAQSKQFNNINQFLLLFFIILLAAHRLTVTVSALTREISPVCNQYPHHNSDAGVLLPAFCIAILAGETILIRRYYSMSRCDQKLFSKKALVYTYPFTSEITTLLLTILTGKANGCSQC